MTRSDIKKNNKFINRTLTPMQVIGECLGFLAMTALIAAMIYFS